jgi:hypothetical protein
MQDNNRLWWTFPWNYRESLAIIIGLLVPAFFLDYVGINTISLSFPNDLYLLAFIIITSVYLYIRHRKSAIIKWLSSIHVSIIAILLYVIFSVIVALIPNGVQNEFIEGGITRSWMYHIVALYMFFVLAITILKRSIPFKKKNIFFILNHLGLWLMLFFASISSYNIEILNMYVNEGDTVWYAFDKDNVKHDLPFAIKLNDFDIEEYTAKLAFIDNDNSKIIEKSILNLEEGDSCTFRNVSVKMKRAYKSSVKFGGIYHHSIVSGASAAALVSINRLDKWISAGTNVFPAEICRLSDEYSLVMLSPEPKRFFSDITVYEKDGSVNKTILEVNKPLLVKDWYVYQKSYNKEMGRWSNLSVLELVKDPYLWEVYLACLMMIIGSFSLIYKGKR